MPECVVTCDDCKTDKGFPRKWYWLCEDCAVECQDQHRTQTGHHTHLHVTVQATIDELMAQACNAEWWHPGAKR